MMKYRLLIVDDEAMLTEMLSDHFTNLGYEVYPAGNAEEMMEKLNFNPDLILLDINMPGTDGITICRRIRDHVSCPIIFLTAKITEQDKLNGLYSGGDDYITKPFSLKELTARVEMHLRRDARSGNHVRMATVRGLLIDFSECTVSYEGNEINFSRREFEIIEFLLSNANQVFGREHIYEAVWGLEAQGNADVVKEHVRRIRAKLLQATGQEYIETVWGMGYRWRR